VIEAHQAFVLGTRVRRLIGSSRSLSRRFRAVACRLSLVFGCGCGQGHEGSSPGADMVEGGSMSANVTSGGAAGSGAMVMGGVGSASAGAALTGVAGTSGASVGGIAGSASGPGDAWILDSLETIGGLTPEVWGAPTLSETPQGRALCFDGDDGVVLSQNPLQGFAAFTVQVLFRPESVLESEMALAEPRFIHIETAAADRLTVEARVDASGFYLDTFISSAGQSKTLSEASQRHAVGAWHWAALSYANGTMRHYVDGIQDASAELNASPLGPGTTSVGVRQNHLYWFKGCVRELRFAAEALPIQALARLP
jgi:hypothetical protein